MQRRDFRVRRQIIGRLKNSLALFRKHEVEKKHRRMRVRRVFGETAAADDIYLVAFGLILGQTPLRQPFGPGYLSSFPAEI